MKRLGLLKENAGVSIVALTPDNVSSIVKQYAVLVEKGAGDSAGFLDEEYAIAGARIVASREYILKNSDILVTHSADINFSDETNEKVVIGGYSVLDQFSSVLQFNSNPINLYSLALLPRTTKAQSMDILSSLAALSGYQAVIRGFFKSKIVSPMISSAGGTLYPANVLVLGAGVAGLQAIATAKRLGAVVNAFDIRKQTKIEVESLGGSFIEVEGAIEDEASGGYAVEQGTDFMSKVQDSIAKYTVEADLVITTARIPGKEAPLLITNEMVNKMKPGTVIIDLAADTGGNCALIKQDKEIIENDVLLIGDSYIYNQVPRSASILLGNNITTFINHFVSNENNALEDEILRSTLVTRNGKIVHEKLCAELNNY